MKTSVRKLLDYRIQASDGEIGSVSDVLFDEVSWEVRYIVVDTGGWLTGKKVLVSTYSVRAPGSEGTLLVELTKEQVKSCPVIDSDPPIDRARQIEYHDFFHWPYYWGGGGTMGGPNMVGVAPEAFFVGDTKVSDGESPARPAEKTVDEEPRDESLRSAKKILGFKLRDGETAAGEVSDFIVDTESWMASFVQLKMAGEEPQRSVLVPVDQVLRMGPPEDVIELRLPLDTLAKAPDYREAIGADAEYLEMVSGYYRRAA